MKKIIAIFLSVVLAIFTFACTPKPPPAITPPIVDFEDEELIKPSTAISRDGKYVDYVNLVGAATGPNAKVSTVEYGVYGTDLGVAFYSDTEKRMYYCFGDTYAGDKLKYPWNNNAILYADNLNLSKGINFSGAVKGIDTTFNYGKVGKPLQITPDAHDDKSYPDKVTKAYHPLTEMDLDGEIVKTSTCIPTGAVEVGSTYYMYYMEVTEKGFGDTGQWSIHSNRVMKSTDKGKTWSQLNSLKWDYDVAPNFGQIFTLEAEGYIYLYGLAGGRQSSAKLARVRPSNIENMALYEYYIGEIGGQPQWASGNEGLAIIRMDKNESTSVIYAPCGEMSVMYNEYLKRYVATYQMGSSIVLRLADKPYGPFSNPDTIVKNGEYELEGIYAAFSHEKMTANRGQKMYFLMSVWFPVYNVQLMEFVFK